MEVATESEKTDIREPQSPMILEAVLEVRLPTYSNGLAGRNCCRGRASGLWPANPAHESGAPMRRGPVHGQRFGPPRWRRRGDRGAENDVEPAGF